jgi:hypothetical protein
MAWHEALYANTLCLDQHPVFLDPLVKKIFSKA